MAKYEIKKEDIDLYVKNRGSKFENTLYKFKIEFDGQAYTVANKKDYNFFMSRMEPEQLQKKVESGTAVWRNLGGSWLVCMQGDKLEKGTVVTVERKDGNTSQVKLGDVAASENFKNFYYTIS